MGLSKPETEETRVAELKIKASLRENDVLVSSPEGVEGFSSRGYGVSENGKLGLTFYEALFLLGKGVIEIKDETGQKVGFQERKTGCGQSRSSR